MDEHIRTYLRGLEAGDYEQLSALFAEGAMVHSPLYGKVPAREFYRQLLNDSAASRIRLIHTFHQAGGRRSAAYFVYEWTLADGSRLAFDCVDLFEWDAAGKISELRIIYDTSLTRPAFERR